MALPVWQGTAVSDTGDVQPGAQIDVIDEATGLVPAGGIYSDRAGTVALTNPFFADSEGFAQFYVAAGEYRITATGVAGTRVWRYEVLTGTAATADLTTSATDTTGVLRAEDAYDQASINWHSGNLPVIVSSWTPTFSNLTIGNGTALGSYIKIGRTAVISCRFVFGSTTAITGVVSPILPFTAASGLQATIGSIFAVDTGTSFYDGTVIAASGVNTTTSVINNGQTITATVPFTWTTGDILSFSITLLLD